MTISHYMLAAWMQQKTQAQKLLKGVDNYELKKCSKLVQIVQFSTGRNNGELSKNSLKEMH